MEIAQQQQRRQGGTLKNPVTFRPADIFRQLGYRSDGLENYRLLREWGQRMIGTLIISNNAVYLAKEDKFISADFVLFHSMLSKGSPIPNGEMFADRHYVWLHDWQIQNLNRNHTIPIFESYKRLKTRIGKAMVPLLGIWFYASRKDRGYFEKRYDDFCEVLSIRNYRYKSDIAREHGKAFDDLQRQGFLARWELTKTADRKNFKIRLYPGPVYQGRKKLKEVVQPQEAEKGTEILKTKNLPEAPITDPKQPALDPKQGIHSHLVPRLMKWGIAESKTLEILSKLAPDQSVEDQLEYAESEIDRQGTGPEGIQNPAGFIISRLLEDAPVPDDFETRTQRRIKEEARREAEEKKSLKEAWQEHKDRLASDYIAKNPEWNEQRRRHYKDELLREGKSQSVANHAPQFFDRLVANKVQLEILEKLDVGTFEQFQENQLKNDHDEPKSVPVVKEESPVPGTENLTPTGGE